MRWSWLRWLILISVTLATTLHIIALAFEHRLLLRPERCRQYYHFTPETSETIVLDGGGLLVRLRTPPSKEEEQTTFRRPILFCHGNAGNIDSIAPLANGLHGLGYDVHVLEYAGFGTACVDTGPAAEPFLPTPQTMVRDLKNAWQLMPNKADAILLGFSMGGGAIFQLVAELSEADMPAQIVVANTYFSLPQLVQEIVWISMLGPLMRTQWTAEMGLSRYRKDGFLLVIGTPDDELIPFRHSELIRDCALRHHLNVQHLTLPGGGHVNSIFFHTGLWYDHLLPAFNREIARPPIESKADGMIESKADGTIESKADVTLDSKADATVESKADVTIESNVERKEGIYVTEKEPTDETKDEADAQNKNKPQNESGAP